MKLISFRLAFGLVALLFLSQCAKRGAPTGGPFDTIPPVLVNASPKQNTVFFDKEKFELIFDEYVTLKDITKQLIISPPMESSSYSTYPQTGVSKKVSLVFKDSLQEETTYTFNFGESIQDYNEGNILSYFSYTLSTGAIIGSLGFRGRVTDAFLADTPPYVSLQLYPVDSTFNDSTIYTQKPLYVANTLDSTLYQFQNLKAGTYELIALLDNASNYYFDQNIDKIGFVGKRIELPGDSIVDLRIFNERVNFSWDKPFFINDHHITLPYFGHYDKQPMEMISEVPDGFESLITRNRETDSLNYWFVNGPKDSIQFQYPFKDSLRMHTVKYSQPIPDSLVLRRSGSKTLLLKDSVLISSNLPIVKVDDTRVRVRNQDSLYLKPKLILHPNKDQIRITIPLEPNDRYQFEILPNAFFDFFGATNDSLSFELNTNKYEDYGNLNVQFKNFDAVPLVIDLLDSEDNVIRRVTDPLENNRYSFDYLEPGQYMIRVIIDSNDNNQWDTGNYLDKIQPEEVFYLTQEIDLRANWDVNQVFDPIQIRRDRLKNPAVPEGSEGALD